VKPGSVTAVSSNWAGYVVTGTGTPVSSDPGSALPSADSSSPSGSPTTFTSVTATWKQPKATCDGARPTFSAVWVGLGGFNADSQALEQIGTEADCRQSGKPAYLAWYELVPAPPVNLGLRIVPGDTITASVNVNGTSVLVQIKDRTRRTSFTKQLTISSPDLTAADWIVEAPSVCNSSGSCQPLPLANFGSVSFTRIATTGGGHAGTVTDPSWSPTPIQLTPRSDPGIFATISGASTAGATPADASADGRTFTVTWQANTTPLQKP
jgi:hypothetical protein